MIARVSRERGRSWQLLAEDRIGSNRYSKLRDDPSAKRPRPNGDETQTLQGIATRRQRSETTDRKSQCPIVVLKRGNGPFGPRGAKGVPRCGRGVGTTPRTSRLNGVSPRNDLVV